DQLQLPRARACKHLREFTRDHAGKSDLDARHLDAALRLLTQTDVKEAIRWWQEIEAEAARHRGHERVKQWTERLLAPEGAAADGPVRPLVLASLAGALTWLGHREAAQSRWMEVHQSLGSVPLPHVQEQLRLRAVAGQVAVCFSAPHLFDRGLADEFLKEVSALPRGLYSSADEQVAAGLLGAVEALVEFTDLTTADLSRMPPERRDDLRQASHDLRPNLRDATVALANRHLPADLRAFALALTARAVAQVEPETASSVIERLHRAAPTRFIESWAESPWWMDWRSPEDVPCRIGLEYLRVANVSLMAPERPIERL